MKNPDFVVVVGTSGGGMQALSEMLGRVPASINAAIVIVMHLGRSAIADFLVQRLQPVTDLPCQLAGNDSILEAGHIYIAPSDVHVLVKHGRCMLGRGPAENSWRPCIDVLFRSAAVAYNSRAIGVILTGMRDDGTAGMLAVKSCGGQTIVQDPNEAEHPDMPLSVLNSMEVNYSVPLAEMGRILIEITGELPAPATVPEAIQIESEIAERIVVDYEHVKRIGEKSIYACPDCGGGLWDIKNGGEGKSRVVRYRCHIGHSYSENDLVIKQGEIFETTLWTALRIMEERRNLFLKLERDHVQKGLVTMGNAYKEKATAIQVHVDKMKEVLFSSQELGS